MSYQFCLSLFHHANYIFLCTNTVSVCLSSVIRSVGQGAGSRKQRERRRFAVYSIYAWGLPSALTTITAAMDVSHLSPAALKPDMGVYSCWFSSNTDYLHYYYRRALTGEHQGVKRHPGRIVKESVAFTGQNVWQRYPISDTFWVF
jgi:hypothetical protein